MTLYSLPRLCANTVSVRAWYVQEENTLWKAIKTEGSCFITSPWGYLGCVQTINQGTPLQSKVKRPSSLLAEHNTYWLIIRGFPANKIWLHIPVACCHSSKWYLNSAKKSTAALCSPMAYEIPYCFGYWSSYPQPITDTCNTLPNYMFRWQGVNRNAIHCNVFMYKFPTESPYIPIKYFKFKYFYNSNNLRTQKKNIF